MTFAPVTTWIFDLDNTLYPAEVKLFTQIEARMNTYVMRELGVDASTAQTLRKQYWRDHGTTLAGLMAHHQIDPMPYLHEVHDIDFSELSPDPALADAIRALPGRKIVHTNGDGAYAQRVLEHRGLQVFDAIFGIDDVGFHSKPNARSYDGVMAGIGFDPATAAMFEDDPRNLLIPDQRGMRTVLVGPARLGPNETAIDQDHGPHVHFHTHDLAAFLRNLPV